MHKWGNIIADVCKCQINKFIVKSLHISLCDAAKFGQVQVKITENQPFLYENDNLDKSCLIGHPNTPQNQCIGIEKPLMSLNLNKMLKHLKKTR